MIRLACFVSLLAVAVGCGSSSPAVPDAATSDASPPPPGSDGSVDGGDIDGGDIDGDIVFDASVDAMPPPAETDFFSSFEPADPQPSYVDTVETDPSGTRLTSGITGKANLSVLGSIMDKVTEVIANGENPPGEIATAIADGEVTTKWLVVGNTGWVRMTLSEAIAVKRYAVSSANDEPPRDPKDWLLEGSQDGQTWTTVDSQTDRTFAERFETQTFDISNTTAYAYYRLNVTRNAGAPLVQIAELQLSDGSDTPPPPTDMRSDLGRGPGASHNARLSAGFTGVQAFHYAGVVTANGRGYSYNKIFDVSIPVVATSELSYVIHPDDDPDDARNVSTFAAVDLAFDDGTYLSQLDAIDQHYAAMSPQGQGASRTLYTNEWNYKVSRIGAVAAGKTIKRILVGYDYPNGPASRFGGWIDDIRIVGVPAHPTPAHLADYVLTTRGTNSSGGYSRGNNFPATAVPHGFNFWTPVTNAGSDSWLYQYAADANSVAPKLQAFSLSHEPSPWMGDRQSFQVFPSTATFTPSAGRDARALTFSHDRETAHAHYYSVKFDNGIQTEIAPTDHAAIFRFRFPGNDANLLFDNTNNNGQLVLDASNRLVSGFTDTRSGGSAGATRMFFYATFDKPVMNSAMLGGGGGQNVTGFFKFNVGAADRSVTMRIATSLLSVDQARKNLELEIAASDTFEVVRDRAQALWDEKLGIIQVEGGNLDQLNTLYSNLYRLFLYPSSGFENTGTAAAPIYEYASPVSPLIGPNTPTTTGAKIVTGKIYVNNGFWDTYRTSWPLLSLLTPTDAGQMIDGFLQQYRDGGWVSRWSSPGYSDLMTGTSADVAFADAYVKGVTGFDARVAYDAALKDAMVVSPDGAVGRKGLQTSIFLGYTPTTENAGLSWAMAGYLNDFGIANLAAALAAANPADPRHQEYVENAEYFLARSQGYVNLFDPAIGFFQGKNPAGVFALPAASYDPRVWGFDYTETDGWNTAFDAPQDGQGLANLYGGRPALAAKLDEFFATPETGRFPGSYGGVIHEMLEAKDVRMGQLGLSNQPSFHILYMYDYAGQPARTQEKVRDALARLFVGSNIGQGYLGDEDNGATSAWQIFGALGFYPLQVGSASYVIGSPLFTKATIKLENGHSIVINAPTNSARNVYIQSLQLNGAAYDKTYLQHDVLTAGATLDFVMGPTPSSWGTAPADAPPSITTGAGVPVPLRDATRGAAGTATASDGTGTAALFDDTSATAATFTAANPSVDYQFATGAPQVTFYTLTSGAAAGDPTGWTLSGSNDGASFTAIDTRSGQVFANRQQTRAFKVSTPGAYRYYRLALTGAAGTHLAEVELLRRP